MDGEVHHQVGLSCQVNVPTTDSTEAQKRRIRDAILLLRLLEKQYSTYERASVNL